MPIKLENEHSGERRRASLDERAAELAREARRAHERERELEAREAALAYRENQMGRREAELNADITNPRLAGTTDGGEKKQPDWNLPTIAANIDDVHAYIEQQRRDSAANPVLPLPTTGLGRAVRRVRDVCSANPLATFALGFAVGVCAVMLLWAYA